MTERFGSARSVEAFSIAMRAVFRAHRMGALIRRLTVFFLFKIQNCGLERRRVCCAGVEQSLPCRVYRQLYSISKSLPFFAIATRTFGLAQVAGCFGITRMGFRY